MIRYVGIDLHKAFSVACFVDRKGKVLDTVTFDTTRTGLKKFAQNQLDKECRVAFESTTNSWGVVDILRPYVKSIVVSNARKTKAIAEAKIKTDKVDARVLAQLLRVNFLPEIWIPDEKTIYLRRLMSRRRKLVQQRTSIKNRIHSVLHQLIVKEPKGDLFNPNGLVWLSGVALPEWGRASIDSDLRLIEHLNEELKLLEKDIAKQSYAEDKVKLLMTLPGVDMNTAITLVAALGDISRFKNADKAASYIGLTPSTRQSAYKCYNGHITKQGNSNARWMLIQAAQTIRRHDGPIGNFYRRIATKKGNNIAVVAAARKLVVYAWHMIKNNEPYRFSKPKPTLVKLAKLRILATGVQRKKGSAKGKPRSKNYGTGKHMRILHSISDVCAREGLPEPTTFEDLSTGEQRHIRKNKMARTMRSIHTTTKIPERGTAGK